MSESPQTGHDRAFITESTVEDAVLEWSGAEHADHGKVVLR